MSTPRPEITDEAPLRDITPSDALELYIKDKRANGASPLTIRSHRSRLSKFIDWFQDETDYTYLNELDGFDIKLWKFHRFGEENDAAGDKDWNTEYSVFTVKTQLDTLRVFLKFAAELQAVPLALPHRIKSPSKGDEKQRHNEINDERCSRILEYLDRYQYASFPHALVVTLWYPILRVGAAHSLDLDDFSPDEQYLRLRHRPPETTLKNKSKSERKVAIREKTANILADYINEHRHDVTDDAGRKPLFTTENGRASITTLRNTIYSITTPCFYTNECPHDKEISECQAASSKSDACKCPTSESTHAIRRGSITWHLREDVSKEVISDRADVSVRVIDSNYNQLTETERMELRRDHLPDDL